MSFQDERTYVETISTSLEGSYIARTSALTSAVSSVLIIVMILRSSQSLSITYHRLMFGMSVCDALASFSMAMTTLPLPTDMIYTQFEGRHLGNFQTCEAQGFMAGFGLSAAFAYNVALCIYYFSSIKSKLKDSAMRNWGIRKWVEPMMHICCISLPIALMVLMKSMGYINPSPYLPWCGVSAYPYWCHRDAEENCDLRGGTHNRENFHRLVMSWVGIYVIGILAIVISMVLIVCSVYRQEKLVRKRADVVESCLVESNEEDMEKLASSKANYRLSKVISIQAASYVLPILITSTSGMMIRTFPISWREIKAVQICRILMVPLQGFFNLLVFVGDKVYSYRLANPEIHIWKACIHILIMPMSKNFVFSQMSLMEIEGQEADKIHSEIDLEGVRKDKMPPSSGSSNDSPRIARLFSFISCSSETSSDASCVISNPSVKDYDKRTDPFTTGDEKLSPQNFYPQAREMINKQSSSETSSNASCVLSNPSVKDSDKRTDSFTTGDETGDKKLPHLNFYPQAREMINRQSNLVLTMEDKGDQFSTNSSESGDEDFYRDLDLSTIDEGNEEMSDGL